MTLGRPDAKDDAEGHQSLLGCPGELPPLFYPQAVVVGLSNYLLWPGLRPRVQV